MSKFIIPMLMTPKQFINPVWNGLVGFWPLNVSNSNDVFGLLNGSDTNITYGTVASRSSAGFNVSQTSKINLSNNTRFNVVNLTISAWINTTSTNNLVVVGKSHTTSFYLNVSPTVNDISFWTSNQHTNPGSGVTNINDGNWHHVCATYNAGSKVLYWDNSVIASDAGQSAIGTDTNNVYIGNSDSAPGNNFIGNIYGVGIYNRGLSSSEVSYLFNSGNGIVYPY